MESGKSASGGLAGFSIGPAISRASSPTPESSLPETVPHEGKNGQDQEDNEEYLRPFPGKGCHSCKAEEGSDQSNDEKHDSEP